MSNTAKHIIAIGGGGFGSMKPDTKFERYILAQTAVDKPKIGFLAQASNENAEYTVRFYQTFLALGAEPSHVSLFGRVEPQWRELLLQQDVIYVGGGNTRSMLALWREWGADTVLKQAYEQGTILCGVSAGAICWFEQGITDSVWPLGSMSCLGFVTGSCCPHYDSEPEREPSFTAKVDSHEVLPGIALQDNTAAHYVDGKLYQVIKSKPEKQAFTVNVDIQEPLATVYLED